MKTTEIPLQGPAEEPGRRLTRTASLLVLFLAVAGGTGGTWAAFTASTANDSSFATGVLVISNQREDAAACFSTTSGEDIDDNEGTCDELFTLDTRKPGDEDSVRITLKNEGNLDAGDLRAYASETCTTALAATTFHGNDPDLCDEIQLMVQEYVDADAQENDVRAGGTCVYGLDAGPDGSCDGFDGAHHLADFSTLADFNQAVALDGGLPDGSTRWFRVFVKLPSDAGNDVQGLEATFGITWRAVL